MSSTTPKATLRLLDERDGVRRCTLTGVEGPTIVPQHRQGGMGGRIAKHDPDNVVWIDSITNGLIKDDAEWQALALVLGAAISIHADPRAIPVFYRYEQQWFRLTDGERHPITAMEALDMMHAFYGDRYFVERAKVANEFGGLW